MVTLTAVLMKWGSFVGGTRTVEKVLKGGNPQSVTLLYNQVELFLTKKKNEWKFTCWQSNSATSCLLTEIDKELPAWQARE